MENTLKLLRKNRPHLDAVSKELLAKNRLYRNDLQVLLPPCSPNADKPNMSTQNLVAGG